MRINKLKLIGLIVGLFLIQTLTNSLTIFYIDCLEVSLVIFLLYGSYSITSILLISILADFASHWYLGSHLLGIILISFLTTKLVDFFNISSFITKWFLVIVFYSIAIAINLSINYILGNFEFSLMNYSFNLLVVIPTTLLLFHLIIDKRFMDILL